MFWIYGGAFQFGSGDLNAYDGSAFAAYQDVVLVTHNYRTNGMTLNASVSGKLQLNIVAQSSASRVHQSCQSHNAILAFSTNV